MAENCPICKMILKEKISTHGYDCPRCGKFYMSIHTKAFLPRILGSVDEEDYKEKTFILSHAIRKMQKSEEEEYWPNIQDKLINEIIKRPLPKPSEQKDIFVRWVGDNIKAGGDYVTVNCYSIQAIIGARTSTEFRFILEHLKKKGIIESGKTVAEGDHFPIDVTLTFEGWEYYNQLKRGNTGSRKVFMAMEYGVQELDEIVDNYFKPAVAQTGFELYRLDENPKAGLIDDHLRVEIRNSRFLISDLSHENAGAYWEAGYAEGLGKPVIYTCKKEKFDSDKSHFDTNHHLTVIWDTNEIQKAIELLKATIRATLPAEAKLNDS